MQTISTILVVRCSDTIPAQNWLNTRFEKVGMMRVTRRIVAMGSVKALRVEMAVRNEIESARKRKKDSLGNNQQENIIP
ncbi:hypothetical protein [Massilia suwonensis]|uniref:Uncharacterized protein n=1 Tax=Massilia suwonensis TaxID=648895 RepID=A0ABW0MWN2_9BURK